MIQLTDVSRVYTNGGGGVTALQDVSLSIGAGEYVAIIGPSGSGKSTLLHVLGCLDRPDKGQYLFQGVDVTSLSDAELAAFRNRRFGFVFQQFHLLSRAPAVENVMLPMVYTGRPPSRETAVRRLEEVGLQSRITHRPNQLSGGEQQRVAIARALVNDPALLLADEPTGNLDSRTEEDIVRLLEQLNAQGKTLIVVTHESSLADRAGRVIHMRDGRVVSDEKKHTTVVVPAVGGGGARNGNEPVLFSLRGGARLRDHVQQAFSSMWAHKTRSMLSLLGVLIGVAAVIAMTAVTGGARNAVESQIASMGSNLLVVRPGRRELFGVALERGAITPLVPEDADSIAKLPSVSRTSATVQGRVQAVWGANNANTQVQGVGLDYPDMRASRPLFGRFFTESELKGRVRVALIGPTVQQELFGDKDPVGTVVRLNSIPFTVIGILPPKGGPGFHDANDVVVVPLSTAMYRLLGKQRVDSIDVEVRDADLLEPAKKEIQELFVRKHFTRNPDEAVTIFDMTELQTAIGQTTKTMSMLLAIIAGVSLIVGGIGIMNIMLVSVTERTREIGLRKAIGARRRDIMAQFLAESVVMTVTGGIMGFLIGVAAAAILSHLAKWPIQISAGSAVLAVVFSIVVGVVFGLWPARQASRLDPIAALRYE